MNTDYDFDEQEISEHINKIQIPILSSKRDSGKQLSPSPIHHSLLQNLQQLFIKERKDERYKLDAMKEKQAYIGQRVKTYLEHKNQRIKELQKIEHERRFSECTFQPKVHGKVNTKKTRGFVDFLDQQKLFTCMVQQKRKVLKKNLEIQAEKQLKKNNKLIKSKGQVPVYQRLYALKDKENLCSENTKEVNKFQPTITAKSKKIQRNAPVDQLLYGDALRRQQKTKENSHPTEPKQEKNVNMNNQKYVAQKFIKQYFNVLEGLQISTNINFCIDRMGFQQILERMGFIQPLEEHREEEIVLAQDAYDLINAYKMNARNVCVFLLGIIGIFHINPVNFEDEETSDAEKQLSLDENEGRKMQRHFNIFFRNKLSFDPKKEVQIEEYSFHPTIDSHSQHLADKYRQQMLEEANKLLEEYPEIDFPIPADGTISHTDLLVLRKMATELKNYQKKKEQNEEGMGQCTFKPTLLSSMRSSYNSNMLMQGHKKSLQLYGYHKDIMSRKQSIYMGRLDEGIKECTFAPKINSSIKSTSREIYRNGQIDQTIYRMYKGRSEYERRTRLLQRGQKHLKSQEQMEMNLNNTMSQQLEEQVPTLILDINLGDKTDRVILYRGDEQRLEEITSQFASKHQLDTENQNRLLEMLRIQVDHVLSNIQEEECDSNEN